MGAGASVGGAKKHTVRKEVPMVTLKRPLPRPPILTVLGKEGPSNRENGTSDSITPSTKLPSCTRKEHNTYPVCRQAAS